MVKYGILQISDIEENPVLAKRKLNYTDEKKERREKLREIRAQRLEKKRIAELGHVMPSPDEKDVEKALRKVATKGGKLWSGIEPKLLPYSMLSKGADVFFLKLRKRMKTKKVWVVDPGDEKRKRRK